MHRTSKYFSLLLISALAAASLAIIQSSSAQSINKPSVPEFTAKYVDCSYDTQPTYGVDPYTGKTVINKHSEHVDNRTIEITIKNQPFTPFTDATSGRIINLYYNVRYKGAFEQDWTLLFGARVESALNVDPLIIDGYPSQNSASQNTIISYTIPWHVVEGQIDFQAQALKGYVNRTYIPEGSNIQFSLYNYTIYGQESNWSNTQTITIGETSASASPTPTPTVPEFSWIAILPLFAALLFAAVKFRVSKNP